ncbi:MAG: hypothetical protein KKF48_03395 [Nanoarchaeota archaeon]|nr:hypothetical protein [Nanoarchaeota archaeon]MBU1028064.1 hypothetical protein [Nanoarchaeota archaeon]
MKKLILTTAIFFFLIANIQFILATCDGCVDVCKFEGALCNSNSECCPTYLTDHGTFYGYCKQAGTYPGVCVPADGLNGNKNELEWCKRFMYDENGGHKTEWTQYAQDLYFQEVELYDQWDEEGYNYYGWNENSLSKYTDTGVIHYCDLLFGGFKESPERGGTSAATYDYRGNQIRVFGANANLETNFYDTHSYGSPYGLISKISGQIVSSIDPSGKLLQAVDANGNKIKNYYDNADRLIGSEYYNGAGVNDFIVYYYYGDHEGPGYCSTFGDSFNLLCEITDDSGSTRFKYDERGRVVWQEKTIKDSEFGDKIYELEYVYDSANNVVEITLPDSQKIFYDYNTLGQLIKISYGISKGSAEIISDFKYRPSGAIDSKILGEDSIFANYDYDIKEQLTGLYFSKQGPLSSNEDNIFFKRGMVYDAIGNVLGISDLIPGSFVFGPSKENYIYDNVYRLIKAEYPNDPSGLKTFDYVYKNILGDRDYLTISNTGTTTYDYDSLTGRLASYDSPSSNVILEYDSNGNIVSSTQNSIESVFSYDSLNRMVYSNVKGIETNYIYDHSNMRVKKKTPTETTFYLYQGGNVIYEESIKISQTPTLLCGDANNDDAVNIFDTTYLISYLYKGGPAPACDNYTDCADTNGDGIVNLFDVTYLISYLYKGGPAPVEQPGICADPSGNPGPQEMTLGELQNYLAEAQQSQEPEPVPIKPQTLDPEQGIEESGIQQEQQSSEPEVPQEIPTDQPLEIPQVPKIVEPEQPAETPEVPQEIPQIPETTQSTPSTKTIKTPNTLSRDTSATGVMGSPPEDKNIFEKLVDFLKGLF